MPCGSVVGVQVAIMAKSDATGSIPPWVAGSHVFGAAHHDMLTNVMTRDTRVHAPSFWVQGRHTIRGVGIGIST